MPAGAFSEIVAGAGLILGLALLLGRIFAVHGRIGAISTVVAASVVLAVLARAGVGAGWVGVNVIRDLSENLWLPAAMFASAVLVASVV